jgi:ssDNA-binding Zn-finger/Zn-ribbon topoisomerase 1
MVDSKNTVASERVHPCPTCKKPLRRKEGKMGPFWGCSGFPDCRTTLNDLAGKPSTEIDEHYRCPICTRRLVKADKDKGDYWFCSGYSKGCKVTLADHDGIPEAAYRCQKCGHLLVQRKGKNGVFWGCSEYPQCTASHADKDNRPVF